MRGADSTIRGRHYSGANDTETLVAALRLIPDGATFSATGIGRASLPVPDAAPKSAADPPATPRAP
jgi:predicted GNAT family N-acyltransferase